NEVEGRRGTRAVEREQLDAVGELLIVGRHESAVSETEEVLRRIEAEGRDHAVLRDARCAEGLRRVFEHGDAELDQGTDIEQPAEEVDGNDGPRPVGDLGGRVLQVEVERDGVDVREDGRCAAPYPRRGGGVEGEGRADHLVARPDAERVEGEHERVGAVRHADRAFDAEVGGRLVLESPVVRAADEALAVEYLTESGLEPRY